ncbi:hypothetical protein ACO0LD_30540 [Undibacterium sp. Ji83W]|uniref:hypothetical protein n=1 Tax=Undibacterium sp. Ji83W TaxID=3413043 RepID=UPI003BF3E13D
MSGNEKDLGKFVQDAIDEWSDVHAGDAKAANARIRAAKKWLLDAQRERLSSIYSYLYWSTKRRLLGSQPLHI